MKNDIDIESGYFQKNELYFSEKYTGFEEIYSGVNTSTIIYMARKGLKKFTIKALKEEYRDNVFYITQLRKEFEIGYLLDSVHIARYYSFEKIEDYGPCIVREWIDGKPLSSIIKEGNKDLKQLNGIVAEVCVVLEYLHNHGVVHQDLKPANILITNDGGHVKLIDFDFSGATDFNLQKIKGGTKEFASPEQQDETIEGVSFPSDIYSLGKILELMPFSGKRSIRKLIVKMTSQNPELRPSLNEIKKYFSTESNPKLKLVFVLTAILIVNFLITGYLYFLRPLEKESNNLGADIKTEEVEKIEEEPQIIEKDKNFEKTVEPAANDAKEVAVIKEPSVINVEKPGKEVRAENIQNSDESKIVEERNKEESAIKRADKDDKENVDIYDLEVEARNSTKRQAIVNCNTFGKENWRRYTENYMELWLNQEVKRKYNVEERDEMVRRCRYAIDKAMYDFERELKELTEPWN